MRTILLALTFVVSSIAADTGEPSPAEIDSIIAKFAAKEAEFAQARENYTYRQNVKIQETDPGGGTFEVISDIIFSADGKRTERVVRAPVPTLKRIQLTPEDEQDLRAVQPFVLTTNELAKYHIRYLGKQKLDEIPCFAFAVKPRKLEPGQRYFQGVVWVDDRDLQIVKSYGRATGVKKKGFDYQYPKFETFREQVDGKYWFPTYTIANDTLNFESGPVRIRMSVRYADYKQFKSDVRITFEDKPADVKPETPDPKKK
jgi:outer membrane lipoprotein-sorting protein